MSITVSGPKYCSKICSDYSAPYHRSALPKSVHNDIHRLTAVLHSAYTLFL